MDLFFCAHGLELGWLICHIVRKITTETMSVYVLSNGDLVIVETPAAESLK
jgi:glycopeptide antibiotics resistance protein